MAREIQLSNGLTTLVDDADYERFSGHRWHARRSVQASENWYAYRTVRREGRNASSYLHREIVQAPPHLQIDHINGDGLDNRRANLRLCTQSQNNINRRFFNKNGFRGVHVDKGRWRVLLEIDGRVYRASGFTDPETAARAYDALAKEFHGEFAVLNFPKKDQAA